MQAFRAPPIMRGQKGPPIAVPSPVGGWNARDSLDAMAETDAVALDNWFPGLGSVSTRKGSSAYANSLGSVVKMLAEFNAGSFRKFISAAAGKIWDISSAGAGVLLATGFASDAWEWAQFDDSVGGARIGLVNGSDAPQIYNGVAVAAMTISGVGLTPALLNGIHIYKNRSFFWDDRTQDFWYSATNALGGALTKFPLGRVQGTGGNMVAMATWGIDAGNGMQDNAVFILSSGDALIYSGDDPGSASAWQLIGRYNIGAPLGKRAIKKIGADLVIATKAGYIPLASLLSGGRVNEARAAVSSKIRNAVISVANQYSANFGWDMMHYPRGNWLLVNVPLSTTQFHQHVMNTETQAWCRFIGLNAQCWGLYNDALYFGTDAGTVLLADSGRSDNGAAILCDGQPAWNYLRDRRRAKRATAIRQLLRTTGGVLTYNSGVDFDFRPISLTINQSSPTLSSSAWDTSPWDVTPWADDFVTSALWSSVKGDGYAIGSRLAVASATQGVDWFATTYLIEPGGVL